MIETFKLYNQKLFWGLVYTLTSKGEISLELTYGYIILSLLITLIG